MRQRSETRSITRYCHSLHSLTTQVTLNGRELVVWCDAAGTWHAQDDRCPHRLAALSDGFIDKANSQIVCSYQ